MERAEIKFDESPHNLSSQLKRK